MNVYISGPRRGNNTGTYEWCAEVSNCNNVSSYEWEYSYDGFEYHSFGNTECVNGSLPKDYDLHLRVTVTCANGETDIAWFMTFNTSKPGFFIKQQSESVKRSHPELSIYPNPLDNTLHGKVVHQRGYESNEALIQILNLMGEKVDQFSIQLQHKSETTFTRSVKNLPSGYYQAIIRLGTDRIGNESFIISK